MTRATLCLCVISLCACGKSGAEQAREDIQKEQARNSENAPPPPKTQPKPVDPTPVKKEVAPDPEPTTPAEIDTARKKAMIDGRDKDVLKYCDMGKTDDKTDPQVFFGCTLAACRLKDLEKAHNWSLLLAKSPSKAAKPLMDQAKKVCTAAKVPL